jgi:cytochrome b pre-mRNA-processing protein 3
MLNTLMSRIFPARSGPDRDPARRLYAEIVAQARQPRFYAEWGVPDTVEGRFDMISLHAALLFRRLRTGDAEKLLAQDIFDVFFEDMDGSLREMGVGDIVVPKRIAAMGEAFYGRAQSYSEGLDSDDPLVLADAVARNLIGAEEGASAVPDQARALADYSRAVAKALEAQSDEALRNGQISWPSATDAA